MKKSSRSKTARKSHPDFPLTKHTRGYWCKKVKGKLFYFGKVADDPEGQAALQQWVDAKDHILLTGRKPDGKADQLAVGGLVNEFLNARRLAVESGEMSDRTHRELRSTGKRLARVLGKNRAVADLSPDDFERLRSDITATCGPVRLKNEITRTKTFFKWAEKQGVIDRLPRYGAAFDPPTAKTIRLAKAAKGERLYTPEEVHALLKHANVLQKAQILLALNCGYGQTDVSELTISAIDMKGGWIDFPRPKTGIPRRCKLWPETQQSLSEAMEARPPAKDPADEGQALLTRYGMRLVRTFDGHPEDTVAQRFRYLLKKTGLQGRGLSFYRLRHTHRTVADECGDQPACNYVMGHADHTIAGNYRQRISDERLCKVADTVHAWLHENPSGKPS